MRRSQRVIGLLAVLTALLGAAPGHNLLAANLLPGQHHSKPAAAPAEPVADLHTITAAFPDGLTPAQIAAIADTAAPALGREAIRTLLEQADADDRLARSGPTETNLAFYARRLGAVADAFTQIPDTPILPLLVFLTLSAIAAVIISMLARNLVTRSHVGSATTSMLLDRLVPRSIAKEEQSYSRLRRRMAFVTAGLAAMGVYAASLVAIYLLWRPEHPAAITGLEFLLRQGLIFWAIMTIVDLILMPRSAGLRLLPLDNHAARLLYRAVLWTAGLMLVPSWFTLLVSGFGLPLDMALALWLPASTLPFGYLIGATIIHRRLVEDVLIHLGLKQEEDVVAAVLAFVISAYLIGVWLLVVDASLRGGTSSVPRAIMSLGVLLAIPLAAHIIRHLLKRFFGAVGQAPANDAAASGAADPHIRNLMRAIWIVLIALGIAGVAYLWGFSALQVGFVDYGLRVLVNVAVIILLGYVGWALFQRWVDRRLEFARQDDDPSRAQRLQTLLPLFKNFVRIALLVMTAMIVLATMGIEIGPLIAGAGVVGIAIGLGAQATIADILAGVFFLLEDSFRVGDYVEVGAIRGTVEGISLRSMKLRHQRGMLHTLPFGQIKSLTNYTRDWALLRLEFRVSLGTDLEVIRKLVKRIGTDLAADPVMGPDFIQPPKSQGVRRIDGNALVIGVKFITKPGKQFVIRREAYHRILEAFQANGIQLMGAGVVVRVENAADIPSFIAGAAGGGLAEQGLGEADTAKPAA